MRVDHAGPRTWLLAGLAGWALVAWLLSLAGLGGRVAALPDDPSLLQPLPKSRPSPPERLGPMAQYAEIGTRPLFSEDRRPQPFSLQPEGDEAPANTFDYVLTSVLLTPAFHMAILQPTNGGDSVRVKLGNAADEIPAWRLVVLNPRSAVFEGPEGQKTLDLRTYDGSADNAPMAMRNADASADANPPAPAPAPAPARMGPAVAPIPAPASATDADAATTSPAAQAQMEAIRNRIEARRAQLRQEAQQQQAPPPSKP